MRILIITFYFEPDLCAGSFRASAFVSALKTHIGKDDAIDILTTQPNRYQSFKAGSSDFKVDDNISITRIKIPSHKSGFLDQAIAFCVFFIKSLYIIRNKKYDVVFATSSRLLTAFLGASVSFCKDIPLYLDIRDIFTDTLRSMFAKSKFQYFVPCIALLEKLTLNRAAHINLVSAGFADYFQNKYKSEYSFFTNGIDSNFLHFDCGLQSARPGKQIIITYTGNIGEGQGLEKIVPQIARQYRNFIFYIIGDGGRRAALEESVRHLVNVLLLKPMNRKDLIAFYQKSDFLFLHLNNYEAFKKVLPSKIFEYGASYKPIIAGVDGFAKMFIQENLPDSLIFSPCDIDDFNQKYAIFDGHVDMRQRKNFIRKFSRDNIMNDMAMDFLKFVDDKRQLRSK